MNFGHFEGDIDVRFVPGSRDIELKADVVYVDPKSKRWIAPTGFVSDGASIPQVFWSIVGGPLDGPYRQAAIVHDQYRRTKSEPWKNVHRMFYFACRASGVGEIKAKTLYAAVRIGGPRWGEDVVARLPSAVPSSVDLDMEAPAGRAAAAGLDPAEVASWIEQDNPSLGAIERYVDMDVA